MMPSAPVTRTFLRCSFTCHHPERTDCIGHRAHLPRRHLREDRQREDARLMPVSHREVAVPMSEAAKGRQERQRDRIVDHGLYTARGEMPRELVALLVLHDIQ